MKKEKTKEKKQTPQQRYHEKNKEKIREMQEFNNFKHKALKGEYNNE